ncbi:MAG: UbiA family prenyltransferase [Saprospiraceae bacterium]
MKNLIQKFINLILYSNCWIALCAVAMVLQTELIFLGHLQWSNYAAFVFTATLFVYALHRVVGLEKVAAFQEKGRFLVISNFKSHIAIYAGLSGLACLYFFIKMAWWAQVALVVPGVLSLGYVLPIFGKKRRLRDFNFIKIFLIAIVWSWVTVLIPATYCGQIFSTGLLIMTIERALFIFALTLPFDIRDLKVDQHTGVKTIPAALGKKNAKLLAFSSLALTLILVQINISSGFYANISLLPFIISALISSIFIYFADDTRHDYFYTAGVDGMMIVQFVLVYLFCFN